MQVNNQAVYDDWKAKQTDGYGQAVFRFAESWADKMEAAITIGVKLEEVAAALSHEADTDGITGFMYGCAVEILAECWVHGENLRRWHNLKTQGGDEGERANANGSTPNPALLIVKG